MTNAPVSLFTKMLAMALAVGMLGGLFVTAEAEAPAGQAGTSNLMNKTYTILVPNYASAAPDKIDQMSDDITDQQEAIKKNLLFQLTHDDLSNGAKAEVISLIGHFMVYEATDVLIENINFVDERPYPKDADQSRGGYTARRSLAAFGRPSVYSILNVIGSLNKAVPFDKANVDAYCDVLSGIEGARFATLDLQERLVGAKDAKVQAQYRRVLDRMQAYQHTN